MDFDFSEKSPRERYKFMTGVVVPRPIALVVSMSADGNLNAAPFSYFNAMGSAPPLIALGIGNKGPHEGKDTARNIRETHEFTINIVTEEIAEKMNVCSVAFPSEVNELKEAGFETEACARIGVPRLPESPVNLECREVSTIEVGSSRIVIGEILHAHIRDDLYDPETGHVATGRLGAIGRMHGTGWYARTRDLFEMPRPKAP